ncbi:MAG: hypothetical protein WBM04_13685 [Candidatus Korobacteraceae bacterium]
MLGTIVKESVSQKRITVFLLALFVVLLCHAVLLPARDNPMGIKDKQDITLSAPTLVGGTVLPAGDYKVTHEMQGQTHIMIFKQSHGTAEVKTKCTLVPLNEKAQDTRQLYETNAKNEKVLMEMIFRGDTAKHVLEQ